MSILSARTLSSEAEAASSVSEAAPADIEEEKKDGSDDNILSPQEKFIYEDLIPGVVNRLVKHGKTKNVEFTVLVGDSINALVDLLIVEMRS